MNDTEWHEMRRRRIGGSEAPILVGESPYGSPWSLFAEKTGLIPFDLTNTDQQQFGLDAEPWLIRLFERQSKLCVYAEQLMVTQPGHPHRGATLDGLVADHADAAVSDAIGTIQIKTDRALGPKWETAENVPERIRLQCIWEQGVSGLRRGWLTVLHAGLSVEHIEIPWDQEAWARMCAAVDAFWFNHVCTGIPPETDGSSATLDALALAYPAEIPDTVAEIDPELWARWHEATGAKQAAEKAEKTAKAALLAAIGNADAGGVNGLPLVTLRQQVRKTTCGACGNTETSAPFRVLRQTKNSLMEEAA